MTKAEKTYIENVFRSSRVGRVKNGKKRSTLLLRKNGIIILSRKNLIIAPPTR